jgi:hypothetical protein
MLYQPETDSFLCPANKIVRRGHVQRKHKSVLSRADAADCGSCAVKTHCTKTKARILTRLLDRIHQQDALDRKRYGSDDAPSSFPSRSSNTVSSGTRACCCAEQPARRPKSASPSSLTTSKESSAPSEPRSSPNNSTQPDPTECQKEDPAPQPATLSKLIR